MTPSGVIATALLLGLIVLAGGAYGACYGMGRLRASRPWMVTGYLCYALQAALVLAVCLLTALTVTWKVFVGLSGLAYLAIPPMAWRYLETLHRAEGQAR
jgi:hypothetical protein